MFTAEGFQQLTNLQFVFLDLPLLLGDRFGKLKDQVAQLINIVGQFILVHVS